VHGYDDSEVVPYMQPELLSETDQGMQGKAVRLDAGTEVPLIEDNYSIFAMLKAGRLLVVVVAP